jgi:hypothetical protein
MSEKHKLAAIKRLGDDPVERSRIMANRASIRYQKLSVNERKNHMKKMIEARWKNKNK